MTVQNTNFSNYYLWVVCSN